MPHNLYLHSALVQSRQLQKDRASIKRAIKFNTIDSTVALVHRISGERGAIMVLAAIVFYTKLPDDSDWMQNRLPDAYPPSGPGGPPACSSASPCWPADKAARSPEPSPARSSWKASCTGASRHGDAPAPSRGSLAILPAVLHYRAAQRQEQRDRFAEPEPGGLGTATSLFAMFPLLHFTSSRKRMGEWRMGRFLMIAGWTSAPC